MYIYIYIYIYVCVYEYIYIYVYVYIYIYLPRATWLVPPPRGTRMLDLATACPPLTAMNKWGSQA